MRLPPLELQRTVPAHPAPLPVQRVFRIRHPFRILPGRTGVRTGRRPLRRRLVRADEGVLGAEAVKALLLPPAAALSRPSARDACARAARSRPSQHEVHQTAGSGLASSGKARGEARPTGTKG